MHTDWHPQDWILIVEALTIWGVYHDRQDEQTWRARELQREIAEMYGSEDAVDFGEHAVR